MADTTNLTKVPLSLWQLANVSCGFHGGDYAGIVNTLQLMKSHNVQVGGPPSFPDLQGFGRRYMNMDKDDLCACIFSKSPVSTVLCIALGIEMKHVKAHGRFTTPVLNMKRGT